MHFVGLHKKHLQWKTSNQLFNKTLFPMNMWSTHCASVIWFPTNIQQNDRAAAPIIQCSVITAVRSITQLGHDWWLKGDIYAHYSSKHVLINDIFHVWAVIPIKVMETAVRVITYGVSFFCVTVKYRRLSKAGWWAQIKMFCVGLISFIGQPAKCLDIKK